MIKSFMDFFVTSLFPNFISFLDSLLIAPGVSFLGLIVAVTLLCIVIGAVLMRV